MKKFLPIIIVFLLSLPSCFSQTQEVLLEVDDNVPYAISAQETETTMQEKSLREKLSDIYHLEIEQIEKPEFLLKDILTKKFDEKSYWENLHLWGAYGAHTNFNFSESEFINADYAFDVINAGLDGKLKNNNGDFRIMLNVSPLSNRNFVQNLFADMYLATNKIPLEVQ